MSRSITIEDLYAFQFLSRPRISPDGQRIAFVVTTINERKHDYHFSIWVVPTAGGEARCFTTGADNARTPSWSPDGRWLAFVSDRVGEPPANKDSREKKYGKGKLQVWILPTDGGEARQLTFLPHGVSSPIWSPDSKKLLFYAGVGPLDEENEDGTPLPKARVIEQLFYRLDGVGYIYDRRQHLFVVDIAGGEPQQLTNGDWDDRDPAWSPDGPSSSPGSGSRIAFVSSRGEDRWSFPCYDLYTMSIQNGQAGEVRRLTDGTLACHAPSWSPDGKTIAFLASPKYRAGGHVELFTIDADAEQSSPRSLTSEFEGTCSDWTNSDVTDEHVMPPPAWSPDGKTLYVLAGQRGAERIYAISSSEGAGKNPPTLTPGNIHVRDFSIDLTGKTMAVLIEDATRISEIFKCSPTPPGELHQLTHFNDALFDELEMATPEYMPYTSTDGCPIDGWILKPQNFDPTKKHPLIVEIHGGPNSQYGYGFLHEMQMLAGAGYVVFFTNPRGSLGYGRDFALAIRGDWGEKDAQDIMAGIDALVQKGYIDEQRIGVIGGSYGGFMSSWLIGHTDRFKAAVADRAVIDRSSFFGSSDIGWEFIDDDIETPPWDDPERYRRLSPITYVKDMHTPLLLIHSENDMRCNIEQAEQLFAALKYMGREVRFVRFEGQSHGLSRSGNPRLRVERLRQIRDWFDKHLQ